MSDTPLASIRKAMEMMRDTAYRPCPHIVAPPPAGERWAIAQGSETDMHVQACAAMCGVVLCLVAVPG